MKQHITSLLIHGNKEEKSAESNRSLKIPIYETASFDFETSEDMEKAFRGESNAFSYSRISNPTVNELQDRLQLFSGSAHSLCVSSGMAAISNVFLTLCSAGDNIITSRYLFGNTYSLFANTLSSFEIETRFTDLDNLSEIASHIDSNTRAIFLEVPTNPQLIIFDIEKIAALAQKKQIPLVIDNSILTPYAFHAHKFGVDIEIFSNTKFISGGATSIGGAIQIYQSDKWQFIPKLKKEYDAFGQQAFYKRLYKEIYRNIGACLSPSSAWLQLLGLETIGVRIDRIEENALAVAQFLENHQKVKQVTYLSLPSYKYFDRAQKYTNGHGGCLINLTLTDKKACYKMMDKLKMVRRGTNFCDNKSMIIHPASTIYWDYSATDKELMLINEGTLRLSVGLEHRDDIIEDLAQALQSI
jgi:O-acetylhomoserine (thiol)-lyase